MRNHSTWETHKWDITIRQRAKNSIFIILNRNCFKSKRWSFKIVNRTYPVPIRSCQRKQEKIQLWNTYRIIMVWLMLILFINQLPLKIRFIEKPIHVMSLLRNLIPDLHLPRRHLEEMKSKTYSTIWIWRDILMKNQMLFWWMIRRQAIWLPRLQTKTMKTSPLFTKTQT